LLFACFGRSAKPPAQGGSLREEPLCVENSPERRGEFGCSIVGIKDLPIDLRAPVFWHIDRFEKGERARAAIGPSSMAFEAHGSWWLMSVGPQAESQNDAEHVANVNLGALPEAARYSMLVISAYIPSGMTSRVHLHSGVEAFYLRGRWRAVLRNSRASHRDAQGRDACRSHWRIHASRSQRNEAAKSVCGNRL
jgi:hypothetical protein